MKRFLLAVLTVALALTGSIAANAQDAPAKQDTRINGKWHFIFDTAGGARDFDANFTVDAEGKVTGTFGKSSAAGTYKDGHLAMLFDTTSEESGETAPLKLDGKFDESNAIVGTWQFSSYDGDFKAIRPKQ